MFLQNYLWFDTITSFELPLIDVMKALVHQFFFMSEITDIKDMPITF